jgi:hypothetical protein
MSGSKRLKQQNSMVQAGDIEIGRSEGESRRLMAFMRAGENKTC